MKHHITDDEDIYRKLVTNWRGQGEKWADIARRLGLSAKTVQSWGSRWGLVDQKRSEAGKNGQRKREQRQGVSQCST